MRPISLRRRCAIVALALIIAAIAFRAPLASALITRGDDAARNGDSSGAIRYYSRALAIDRDAVRAADRLAFALARSRRPADARAAIDVATTALRQAPGNADLLADRGLAEQHLARWRAAQRDFADAGVHGRDPRYDHLAGRIALRLGDLRAARALFRRALAADPAFAPARAALEQSGT